MIKGKDVKNNTGYEISVMLVPIFIDKEIYSLIMIFIEK